MEQTAAVSLSQERAAEVTGDWEHQKPDSVRSSQHVMSQPVLYSIIHLPKPVDMLMFLPHSDH